MWIILGTFLVALVFGVPLAFTLGLAVLVFLATSTLPPGLFVQQLYTAADSFSLMAIPFFLFAGDLLNRTGMTSKLVDFAVSLFGWMRGGLAHVNIGGSMIFAGISGSAIADAAALGSILVPSMEKEGFRPRFAAAVTATSSIIGPIIPPSIIMIVYGSSLGVPISSLFAAGVVPGVLVGVALMATVFLLGWRGEPMGDRTPFRWRRVLGTGVRSLPALAMPLIIIGGMLGGVFTATEAGAVAVAYAVVVALAFRTLTVKALVESLAASGVGTGLVMFIIAASSPFGWLLSIEQVPQSVARSIAEMSTNPIVVLLMINLFLLFVGMIMETTASVLILGPILLPVALEMGIDPVHFALIVIVNLMIGLATPPLGLSLFVVAPIANETIESVSVASLPFIAAQLMVLALVIYIPALTLWLPGVLGL